MSRFDRFRLWLINATQQVLSILWIPVVAVYTAYRIFPYFYMARRYPSQYAGYVELRTNGLPMSPVEQGLRKFLNQHAETQARNMKKKPKGKPKPKPSYGHA